MNVSPASLADIETRAKRYAEAREKLAELVSDLNAGIEALKRQAMPELKRAIARASEHHAQLKALIEAAPELFVKPRTVVFHGIKCGYLKGKGGIVWDDADAVVAAIQKNLPDQAEALIRWTGKPLKEAINQLDVATLKKIGCRVVDTGDEVFIKPVDSAVDKMVDALLKDATEEAA
ncbi:host-nuclease inhibitor Gam family protein [Achromobacter denitrificans]|uniref:host-nuclease inhibitor Gam family protein n=1 Tax=Achromobacter denitrificans TaxID=32002 RepID=UPI00243191BE|nr:host-nuclease inhibitor Gam family protein [Achromobacter denitrificans]MBV2160527.1 host-nuclease inhibitor Gam family protein [Achromobacter denitrificans]